MIHPPPRSQPVAHPDGDQSRHHEHHHPEMQQQDRIGQNRAKARVSADLSTEGIADIEREEAMEASLADDALRQFEIDSGMITPETAEVEQAPKQLGPKQSETE